MSLHGGGTPLFRRRRQTNTINEKGRKKINLYEQYVKYNTHLSSDESFSLRLFLSHD